MRETISRIIFSLATITATFCTLPAAAQNEIRIENITAVNLGNGRILFREAESEVPLNGQHRIIHGIRSEYIVAEFAEGLYNGPYEYHRDNVLREKGTYKEGTKHGLFTEYSHDGKLVSETPITNGKVDGMVKSYYADGTLESEKGYKNAVEHGPDRRWDYGAEKPRRDHNYFEGKPDGRQYAEIASNAGDYIESAHFDKGTPVGEFLQTWAETGEVKLRGSYKDGKRHGVWETVRLDGKLESETTYAAGLRNGPSKSFFTDNSVEKITMWRDDKREGVEQTFRYDGGRLASEYTYAADKREGDYRIYNDDEKPTLREEGRITRGTEVWRKEYYTNGRVKRVQERPAAGGTWKTLESYDSDGNRQEP